MKIKYLGHSAFEIQTGTDKIIIDPFLVKVPNYDTTGISDIFVTHGHGDHLGSAVEIAKQNNATITAIFELANICSSAGVNTNGIGLGSWIKYSWGEVLAVPAFHSSSVDNSLYSGCPCGFIFKIENKCIFHAGDTALNGEMKNIGELYSPDIALLPVGGHYTMDIYHACIAAQWLNAKTTIPMHYNTFDAINIRIEDLKNTFKVANQNLEILEIEDSIQI